MRSVPYPPLLRRAAMLALASLIPSSAMAADPVVSNLSAAQRPGTRLVDISYNVDAETNIIGTGGVVTRFYSTENQPKRYFRVRRN